MARSQFIDVATGDTYTWEINAEAMPSAVRKRTIEYHHPTAAGWAQVTPVRQQGTTTHELQRLEGTIATQTQHEAFMRFWRISATRTIHYLPCTGGRYEVVVRTYEPTRRRVVSGPRGATLHIWNYTLEMEIVTQIA